MTTTDFGTKQAVFTDNYLTDIKQTINTVKVGVNFQRPVSAKD